MSLSDIKISRSLGIGCLMCCATKTAMLLSGASVVALNQGLLPSTLCAFSFGLLFIAMHSIHSREAQAKLCPVKA